MKVRVGFGLGNLRATDGATLGAIAELLETYGYDSLWCSERIGGPAPDPVAALAFAAARTSRIKLGTSVSVLPGRPPAVTAKEWASLDALSGGRALPAFGLGVVQPAEQQAFGVNRTDRASIFDEALPLIRRLWSEDDVVHHGHWFTYDGVTVRPRPPKPLDVWLGGRAPAELRRTGRLGDGWLASFATPTECAAGRPVVEAAAAEAGRTIDPEHFGAMVLYGPGPVPETLATAIRTRNPQTDPTELVASGWAAVRERCLSYVEVGFSKLVLVPVHDPEDWEAELAAGAEAVLDIQT